MNQIILTTPEELRAIVSESVSQTLAGLILPKNEPDNLTPDAAVGVLEQHGFLISKARLYKLTAKGTCRSASTGTSCCSPAGSCYHGPKASQGV